jgi:hypothetical protein
MLSQRRECVRQISEIEEQWLKKVQPYCRGLDNQGRIDFLNSPEKSDHRDEDFEFEGQALSLPLKCSTWISDHWHIRRCQ